MYKLSRLIAFCMLSSSLTGCGTMLPIQNLQHPEGDSFNSFMAALAKHVRCELGRSVRANYSRKEPHRAVLKDWAAKIEIDLIAEDKGTATPGLSLFNKAATFTVDVSGALETTASRELTMTYFIPFAELIKEDDGKVPENEKGLPASCPKLFEDPVQGDLGINQTLASSIQTWDAMYVLGDTVKGGPFDTITHQVQFIVAATGSVSPSWKLTRVAVNQNATLYSATRTTTDKLTVTMGPTQLEGHKVLGAPLAASVLPSNALTEAFLVARIRRFPQN